MKRRFVVCIVGFAVLMTGVMTAHWFATRPVHRINESTVKQIKEGMTLAEVETILGVPAGDYSTRKVLFLGPGTPPYRGWFYINPPQIWTSNEASVLVHFEDDCVVAVFERDKFELDETWLTKLRRWARLE
jgi:hypothetical protein